MKKLMNSKLIAIIAVLVICMHLFAFNNYETKTPIRKSVVLKNVKLKKTYTQSHVEYLNFSFTYNGAYAESTIYDDISTGNTGSVDGIFYVYLNGTNYYSGYTVSGTYDISAGTGQLYNLTITRTSDSSTIIDYTGSCIYGTNKYI
jgi:hypothetical protein